MRVGARQLEQHVIAAGSRQFDGHRVRQFGNTLIGVDHADINRVAGFDLIVRQNEILGMAAISGNGQKELCEVLFGIRPPTDGKIQINDKPSKTLSPLQAAAYFGFLSLWARVCLLFLPDYARRNLRFLPFIAATSCGVFCQKE